MDSCKNCKTIKPIRQDGFCSTACFNRATKKKPITGVKNCLWCNKSFPFRKSLLVRGINGVGSIKQKYCSRKCALYYRNKHHNPAKTSEVKAKLIKIARLTYREKLLNPKAREKQRRTISGSGHWNWQGGKTSQNRILRNSYKAKRWKIQVFERDNYTCLHCEARNGNGYVVKLAADHIKPWALFPKLRFDISNGRTLCWPCHRKTDTFGGRILRSQRNNFI